jgi:hypothetical protein
MLYHYNISHYIRESISLISHYIRESISLISHYIRESISLISHYIRESISLIRTCRVIIALYNLLLPGIE